MRTQAPKNRLLDAKRQNRLASRLRKLSEHQAVRHIRRLIAIDPKVGLKIANRVLRRPADLEELLREGLQNSNESTSRYWIEALAPRLGIIRTIELVREEAAEQPAVATRALYWLPPLAQNDNKAMEHFRLLQKEIGGGERLTKRFVKVFGTGHVVRLYGGKLDGVLYPLARLVPFALTQRMDSPESLDGPVRITYDQDKDLLAAIGHGAVDVGPGDRLYTEAVYHFAGYDESNGLMIPRFTLLYENDINVGIRGGTLAANSFLMQRVSKSGKASPLLSMGDNVIGDYPAYTPFRVQFAKDWAAGVTELERNGTARGSEFHLKFEKVGASAGVGIVIDRSHNASAVFLLLSGKSTAEENNAITSARSKAAFMPPDSPAWIIGPARPLVLILTDQDYCFDDPIYPLAWIFFRKVGAL